MSCFLKSKLFLVIFILFAWACRKDKIESKKNDFSRNYINFEEGFYVDYQVDSVDYNVFTKTIDTFSFQVKYLNDSIIKNSIEEDVMRVEEYRRLDTSKQWLIERAFTIKVNTNRAVRVYDNVNTIVLSFPISENTVWDGNIKNIKPARFFYYSKIHSPLRFDTIAFDSTVSIIQEEIKNIGEDKYIEETYAKNIGLIEQKRTFIEKDIQFLKGYKTHYKIINYGKK